MSRDEQEILKEARRLHGERFGARLMQLQTRAKERFNETKVEVPEAYKTTAQQHNSNIIEDEGRQIGTLVYAMPVAHLTPLVPEDQPRTTNAEQFVMAAHEELEAKNGPVWWQCTLAQVHDNLGWIYTAPKKVAYKGQPTPPGDNATADDIVAYDEKNTRYKRDAGISAVFDYEYAVTGTVFYDGNVYDPHCVYVWKEVPESTLKKRYGVSRKPDGTFTKATVEGATPPGYPADTGKPETLVSVIEYWDREYCCILTEQTQWMSGRQVKGAYKLDDWEHNFGRVPYFARPAFITEQLDEDKKFSGPLDGLHNEMPEHKILRTMSLNIARQISFASYQIVSKETGEAILDDNGTPLIFLSLEAAKARQLAPGQEIKIIPQSPEVGVLFQELAASQQRMERYQLTPVSKGISPGADTANAALSNLHRFQLSTLDPLAKQSARQAAAIYRFWLERIIDMQETVFVLNTSTDAYLSLSGDAIPSVNMQAKTLPDQGQQQLLIEKHAAEMKQLGLITLEQMYEMWGKENPEEWANAVRAGQLLDSMWPIIMQQMLTDLGMMQAIQQMSQAQEQTGDARNAVPGLVQQAQQMNGMGQGAEGQPRSPGVRMPTEDVNTQRMMAGGY